MPESICDLPINWDGVDFGSLINANANKMAFANSTRGIFVGGSSSGTDMDYVTIASKGNG